MDPRVLDSMRPYFFEIYANPHGTTHRHALQASRAVETARSQMADVLRVSPHEILFTSGATESNNLGIFGVAFDPERQRRTLITQATEHQSVLEPMKALRFRGFNVKVVGVHRNGIINLDELRTYIDRDTLLVSVMLVNNESGVIQPISEIADICREQGALLHCDCAQVLGRIPLDLKMLKVDFATFSGHKIYGPKGIGALFIRKRARTKIKPMLIGGGQQGGLRPGTLPVPLCVGIGLASVLADNERTSFVRKATKSILRIKEALDQSALDVRYNGFHEYTAPGCLNFSFPGVQAESVLERWNNLEMSVGSACEANKSRTSHVLRAMKISRALSESTIRLSVGRYTTEKQVDEIVSCINKLSNRNDLQHKEVLAT